MKHLGLHVPTVTYAVYVLYYLITIFAHCQITSPERQGNPVQPQDLLLKMLKQFKELLKVLEQGLQTFKITDFSSLYGLKP